MCICVSAWFTLFVASMQISVVLSQQHRNRVLLAALFESGTGRIWKDSQEVQAVREAIRDVNRQSWMTPTVLDFTFEYIKCDISDAINALYRLMYERRRPQFILGPSCPEATKTVALIAEAEDVVQVSYSAVSPALSEREKYRNFVRLCESATSHNAARVAFLQHFGWKKVALVEDDVDFNYLAFHELEKELHRQEVKIVQKVSINAENIQAKLALLQKSHSRIMFVSMREQLAGAFFCEVYKQRMFGKKYIWILPKLLSWQWWKRSSGYNCTPEEMDKALQGYFAIDSASSMETKFADSNQRNSIDAEGRDVLRIKKLGPYAPYVYDTIWAVALAVQSFRKENVTNRQKPVTMASGILNKFQQLQFEGLTGPVSFKGPDRVGVSAVFQNFDNQMRMVSLIEKSFPNFTLVENCSQCYRIHWPGNLSTPPLDGTLVLLQYLTVPRTAFVIILCACIIGTMLATAFLAFNCHFHYLKYIKLSSPRLNNVAVLGCILIYLAIIIMGLDDAFVRPRDFQFICPLRVILYPCGFTLQFGSMFAKTFRIYVIFRKAYKGVIRKKLLRDNQLLGIIAVLALIDLTLSASWLLIDPSQRMVTNLSHSEEYVEKRDTLILPQQAICVSRHTVKWMLVQCLYKALLLLFGVYMAWSTRKVHIPALNDSRFIGFSVYNVVLSNTLFIALYLILHDRPAQLYIVSAANLTASTTATLLFLFVPKIYVITKNRGNPVIRTSSNAFQVSNARTLTIYADRNESAVRARIQNRVFTAELEKLRHEVRRLTTAMNSPINPHAIITTMDKDPQFDRSNKEEMNRLLAECYEAACSSDSGLFFASFDEDSSLFASPKESTGLKAGLRSLRPYVPYMPLKLPSDLDRRPSACPVIPEDDPQRKMSGADSPLRRQSTPCVDSSDPRRGQRRKLRLLSRDCSRDKVIAPDESSEAAMLP